MENTETTTEYQLTAPQLLLAERALRSYSDWLLRYKRGFTGSAELVGRRADPYIPVWMPAAEVLLDRVQGLLASAHESSSPVGVFQRALGHEGLGLIRSALQLYKADLTRLLNDRKEAVKGLTECLKPVEEELAEATDFEASLSSSYSLLGHIDRLLAAQKAGLP